MDDPILRVPCTVPERAGRRCAVLGGAIRARGSTWSPPILRPSPFAAIGRLSPLRQTRDAAALSVLPPRLARRDGRIAGWPCRCLRAAIGRQNDVCDGLVARTRLPHRCATRLRARSAHRRCPRPLRSRIPRDDLRRQSVRRRRGVRRRGLSPQPFRHAESRNASRRPATPRLSDHATSRETHCASRRSRSSTRPAKIGR